MGEVPGDALVEACIRSHAVARVPGFIGLRHASAGPFSNRVKQADDPTFGTARITRKDNSARSQSDVTIRLSLGVDEPRG